MNARQKKFVQEYLKDPNATQAAISAGYSEKTAHSIGHENLRKPEIAAAIAKVQEKAAEKFDISHEEIIRDLVDISAEARSAGVFAPAIKAKELIGRHFGMWPTRVEHTGKDGGPIKTEATQVLDASSLDPDQRKELRAILRDAKPEKGE